MRKILFICTIIPLVLPVFGCSKSDEETDDTPKLSLKAEEQIEQLCERDINCKLETSKEACVEKYSSLYLKLKKECEESFFKLQECALSLACEDIEILSGCEGYRQTYIKCDGIIIDGPKPL